MSQEIIAAMQEMVSGMINGVHTVVPGKVVTFDSSTGLAVIEPVALYKKPDGTTMSYPNISGVPVVFPQSFGQSATIAYPIHPGDGCLLMICEQSLDYWMFSRETDTQLGHDLTNGIAIVGMFVAANATMKRACDENAIVIDVKGSSIAVNEEKISMKAPLIEMVAEDKISMMAPLIEMEAENKINMVAPVAVDGNVSISGNESISGSVSCAGSCNKECKC